MPIVCYYILIINVIGFLAFGIDKCKAKHHMWRIREFTLMAFALLGGGMGCFLGMKIFHHKTRHRLFTIGIPVCIVLNIVFLILLKIAL